MSRGRLSAVALAVAVALVFLDLSGCTFIAGGDPPAAPAPRPTLGRELRDLKLARDDGAVSEAEYCAAKERLLTSYDKR